MTINEIQDQVIDDFSVFEEWLDKYEYLVELGTEMPASKVADRKENLLIDGCQSRVWIDAYMEGGKVYYKADSDAIITKGIISLLLKVLDGHTPQEILEADLYFIDRIGLRQNLSPTRANGLVSMMKQMRLYALAFEAKNN